jgi:DNA-3-methyladenine glycosylase II
MLVTRLYPKPPFNFHLSAMIFAGGDPQIRSYEQRIFRQVLEIQGRTVLVEVFSGGTPETPELYFTMLPDNAREILAGQKVSSLVSSMFNVHVDLSPFYRAMEKDAIMASLTRQLRGVKSPTTPTVFEALVDSIIEQQISLKAAHSIENQMIRAIGSPLILKDRTYYAYPSPQILSETTDATFRACGLTRRKGEYIRDISQQIISGTLDPENFRAYPDTEMIIGELTEIRGVGRWTAELTILRGLHRPDAFPADDIGVRRFISRYYLKDKKISSEPARSFAESWGIWKAYAAYNLEIADLLEISPL